MRRFLTLILLGLAAMAIAVSTALAGSPHFVSNTVTASRSGDTLTVSGKEAGLGDESQVHIVISATAACINPGQHHPKAENKQSISVGENFPVQNGKAEFSLSLTATFQPDCSPPMTIRYTNVVVTDTTNDISKNLGSF